jgi:hypothetical protein
MVYVAAVQAITTLIIGLFAGYIAWRQWRTSQDRLVLDLFEKRFQVFQELTRTIAATFLRVNVQTPTSMRRRKRRGICSVQLRITVIFPTSWMRGLAL